MSSILRVISHLDHDHDSYSSSLVVPSIVLPARTGISLATGATTRSNSLNNGTVENIIDDDAIPLDRPKLCELHSDIICHSLSFLCPADVMSFAITGKTSSSFITHNVVIAIAFPMEGNGCKSLLRIASLVGKGQIFLPSPLRLLRIILGKRCEICINKVRHLSLFGIFLCGDCIHGGRHSMMTTFNPQYRTWDTLEPSKKALILHPQAAIWNYFSKIVVLKEPYFTSDHERAGPLITLRLIDDIVYKSLDIGSELLVQDVAAFLYHVQEAEGAQRLKNVRDSKAANVSQFERRYIKIARIEGSIVTLQHHHLDERLFGVLTPYTWIDISRIPCDPMNTRKSQISFDCQILNDLPNLLRLVAAPGKNSSSKHLQAIGDDIEAAFRPLFDEHFYAFDFLADFDHALYSSLKVYVDSCYTPLEVLLRMDPGIFGLLAEHGSLMTLAALLSGEVKFQPRPPISFVEAFLVHAFPSNAVPPTAFQKMLATTIWEIHSKKAEVSLLLFHKKCERTFDLCVQTFTIVEACIQEYLANPASVRFSNSPDERPREWLSMKRGALNSIWEDSYIINLLLWGIDAGQQINIYHIWERHSKKAEEEWRSFLGG